MAIEDSVHDMASLNNSGTGDLKVPGWGVPIDFMPLPVAMRRSNTEDRFSHGADDFRAVRLTVREIAMLQFMDVITDKPDWNVKVFDDTIVDKWRAETKSQPRGLMSDCAIEWCIKELRDRAKDFERDGFIRTYESASRCIKSDSIIPLSLRDELQKAVQPLLNVDDAEKDWHPDSGRQVLNVVHPSLFPLMYGRSRVLPRGQVGLLDCLASSGKGEVVPGPQQLEEEGNRPWTYPPAATISFWSKRFQWLPADVHFVGETGTTVKISSYINNLHPAQHQGLYGIIERFISKTIPLWNEVLIKNQGRAGPRVLASGPCTDITYPPDFGWEEHLDIAALKEYLALPENPDLPQEMRDETLPEDWENYEGWRDGEAARWKFERIRKTLHPEPGVDFTYEQWKQGTIGSEVHHCGPNLDSYTVKLEETFRTRGLQVIVKLSSVELTPEKPSYPGGSWHLEGMLNEHIVATAIYYYDVENVTEARLKLRQEAWLDELELQYEQDDHRPLSVVFGTKGMSDEPAVQEIGSIATPASRLLVFPNTLQHKVAPFQLADPSRPGHRRFLVIWLCDPHFRLMSTANVPPQQKEWAEEAVAHADLGRLPQELKDMVAKFATDDMMSLEEAKELRPELMKERTTFAEIVEENFDTYNLCEH